jgi:membrane-associated HD superfamily phosphohydrolase
MTITKRNGIRPGEIGHDGGCKCISCTKYTYCIFCMFRMLLEPAATNNRRRIWLTGLGMTFFLLFLTNAAFNSFDGLLTPSSACRMYQIINHLDLSSLSVTYSCIVIYLLGFLICIFALYIALIYSLRPVQYSIICTNQKWKCLFHIWNLRFYRILVLWYMKRCDRNVKVLVARALIWIHQ